MISILLLCGLVIGLLVAAVTDVQYSRIPNWLTLSLTVFGITIHSWNDGWNGFLLSFMGVGVGFLCLIFFYIRGGMGAGDVKLLAAIGSILGPVQVFYAFAFTAILGGLYSVAILFAQGGFQYVWTRVFLLLTTLRVARNVPPLDSQVSQDPKLRYALVIGLGTVVTQTLLFYGLL